MPTLSTKAPPIIILTGKPQKAVAAIRLSTERLSSNSTPKSFNIPARIPKLKLVTNKLAQLAIKRERRLLVVAVIVSSVLCLGSVQYTLSRNTTDPRDVKK